MSTPGENAARHAMRESMRIQGITPTSKGTPMPPSNRDPESGDGGPTLGLHINLPVAYVVSGAIAIGCSIVGMYYQLKTVSESMTEMKVDVKAYNTTMVQYAIEQALMKQRVEKLEQHADPRVGK